MKNLIFVFLVVACGNHQSGNQKPTAKLPDRFVISEKPLPAEVAETNFQTIIRNQETALSDMKPLPGHFQMKEMVTDIAVARTGLLGLSALKSNNGVEVKWARRTMADVPPTKADLVIEENTDLLTAVDSVTNLAVSTGKIKDTPKLRGHISQALSQIEKMVTEVGASSLGKWTFKGVRFDLNFSVNGEVFFFAKAGPNLRLRLEWNHLNTSSKAMTPGSRFVLKTLGVLNQLNEDIYLPGFTARQLSIGVGTTYKGEWGLWKYSSGFLGFLLFAPASTKDNFSVSSDGGSFLVGGFEEKGSDPATISSAKFAEGLRKSLKTAAFFADASQATKGEWYVKEIKTINDLSYTGLFGLADYTTKGSMEIDFKRNN